MYRRVIDIVLGHPRLTIVALVMATAFFATGLTRLVSEANPEAMIPVGDPARQNLHLLEEVFGSDYFTLILVLRQDHPDGIYNPQTLELVDKITQWLRAQPEFETSRNSDLRSISTANNITGDEFGMVVAPFIEEIPSTREQALELRRKFEAMPMYRDLMIARDDKGIQIIVRESEQGAHDRESTYKKIRSYLDSLNAAGHPERMYVTGRTVIEGLFHLYIGQEGRRMLPFCIAMLTVVLYLAFRTVRAALIPIVVITMTQVWMMGVHGLFGQLVYSVTSIGPVLIVAIAAADAIHILARYYEAARNGNNDRERVVRETMVDMGPPIFMTSLTTAIGFLAMSSSSLLPISGFGVLMAVGIASAYVVSILFIPAALVLLPLRPPKLRLGSDGGKTRGWLDTMLESSAVQTSRHPGLTLSCSVVIVLVGVAGLLKLTTDSSMTAQFPPNHHIRVADEVANRHFTGSSDLDLIIDTGRVDGIKDPLILERIDKLQQGMEELELVSDTFSIAELLKHMNRVMNGGLEEHETIPASKELVAQYLLLYSMSGDPGDFDDLIDYDYRYAHVNALMRSSSTRDARTMIGHAEKLIAELFSDVEVDIKMSGSSFTSYRLEDHVNWGQIQTILIATPLLLIVGWFAFSSPWLAILALTPVAVSLISIYGGMGHIGMPTDIATTMLGGMALGIGIDFAIHYLHKFRSCQATGSDAVAAVRETALTTGRAIYYNAMVLFGGFMVMLGSRFYPQMKLGALVSTTMVICYLSTMYLFPAVLVLLSKRRA